MPPSTASLDDACAHFAPKNLPHGAVATKSEVRAANGVFPEACIVRGNIVTAPTSTITWAVELPGRALWNGKTLTFGGSGFDGFTPTDVDYYHIMAAPASAAYARMGSDSGHQVRSFYPWALDDVALKNHAFEANHLTLDVGTAVVAQFYGKPPARRYMLGQSNGGRSGLVAIQRYPNDYDGVIAIEPAMFQQAHQVNLGATTMQHIYSNPQNWLDDAKIALFAKAEIAACDELDGLKDGIIANIAACTYIPTDLECKGADSDACLMPGQIETIRMVTPIRKFRWRSRTDRPVIHASVAAVPPPPIGTSICSARASRRATHSTTSQQRKRRKWSNTTNTRPRSRTMRSSTKRNTWRCRS